MRQERGGPGPGWGGLGLNRLAQSRSPQAQHEYTSREDNVQGLPPWGPAG